MTDPLPPQGTPLDPGAPAVSTTEHASPPQNLVRSPLSDGEWHRLHPLTPLLRGGLVLLIIFGLVVSNLRDRLLYLFIPSLAPDIPADELEEWEGTGDPIDFIIVNNLYIVAILAVLAILLVLIAIFYMSWRFHTFRITGDDVEVRSGILFRTQRRAPLDRVQGVNLTRPMIARLLGMAKLEVVGAGTDANVKLEYLSTPNAEAVRADILRLASGRRLAEAAARAAAPGERTSRVAALGQTVSRGINGLIEGDEAPVDVPESVVHIPVVRLVVSHIISPGTVFLLVALIGVIIGVSQGVTWLLFAFIPALIGFGAYWVRSILRSLRYSIAPTPDGVRITFGLLTTVTEVVPPGRVHAVEIAQPILWRPAGWWSIRINRLSGRNANDTNRDQFTTALPVGTAADVERVLRLLLPAVPDAEWPLIVQEGMFGPSETDTFTTTPKRAWFLRPLSWRRNGFRLAEDVLLLRRGLIWRKLSVLPLARLQSFAVHQGPVDRILRIASGHGHVVVGPVWTQLSAIDRVEALKLFADVARGTVRASSGDRSHRWAADAVSAGAGDAGAPGAADGDPGMGGAAGLDDADVPEPTTDVDDAVSSSAASERPS
ncbi:PH domain-containing protein [Microbacterium pumilum]|uniref:YdbS-like PH domain-containing protein n=1 Tax=Microbacterium pumilum TaxID=344165 RepID=A0ABN2S202_9MICO